MSGLQVHCQACGKVVETGPGQPLPFRCPAAERDDDIDHLLVRQITALPGEALAFDPDESRTFGRYRQRLFSRHLARAGGLSDSVFMRLVAALDDRIATVDGAGFHRTPLVRMAALERHAGLLGDGRIWAKVEAENVSGSHKARHLFGLMLTLQVDELLRGSHVGERPRLAIASCGNAALAAAVGAPAADWPLAVFVPPEAAPKVMARLGELGAIIHICERRAGELGDPCVLRFREAVDAGDLPFCCQGPENGLAIEGGETLGYELIEQLLERSGRMDRVFIQVGGGALASGLIAALRHAVGLGLLPRLPKIHAVQTRGGHPLVAAWERFVLQARERVAEAGNGGVWPDDPTGQSNWLFERLGSPALRGLRAAMGGQRSAFMRPWPEPPQSIAHGILDDETYDWLAIVDGMLDSGGFPLIVEEETLARATEVAAPLAGIEVSPTGAAGLAGLLHALAAGLINADEQSVTVLTGLER